MNQNVLSVSMRLWIYLDGYTPVTLKTGGEDHVPWLWKQRGYSYLTSFIGPRAPKQQGRCQIPCPAHPHWALGEVRWTILKKKKKRIVLKRWLIITNKYFLAPMSFWWLYFLISKAQLKAWDWSKKWSEIFFLFSERRRWTKGMSTDYLTTCSWVIYCMVTRQQSSPPTWNNVVEV